MKERLQKLRDALLERVPQKNYTPEQKAAMTKKTALVSGAVGALILVLLIVALFPVTGVEIVSNQSQYTEQQIMEALDKSAWTPLLNLTPRRAEQRLMDKLLYLESAEVTYQFPSTLCISVTEQQPLYYFYYETQIGGKRHTGWLAVGPDLRVVDAARDETAFAERGLTKLALPAPVLDETEPGRASKLRFTREDETGEGAKTEQDFAYIAEFLSYLESSSVAERLTSVDLAEKFDVKITLDSKYRIELGRVRDERDFAQKLALAEQILAEAAIDPDQKYAILVGTDEISMYPLYDGDPDAVD
ncbi:MAG: FtsQ-type POTRA domain-containing protein [Clostridia bacterium]|nr:FtsQ-type POTRA domain-containing protein [Clostridia bacterium]